MKHLIQKISIFFIPIFIFLLIPFLILFKSQEAFINIDNIVDANINSEVLIGYAFNGKGTNYEYYKNRMVSKLIPDILIIGSSRVLKFNHQMFKASFYNAGFTVTKIEDYLTFLKSLPEHYNPKLLILGIDPWMFNPKYLKDKIQKKESDYLTNKSLEFNNGMKNIFRIYSALFEQKITFNNFNNSEDTLFVGLNALINKKGFLVDGSFTYGSDEQNTSFKETENLIINNQKYFVRTDSIDNNSLVQFEHLLAYCKKRDINVVSFLPPLPNSINLFIDDNHGYDYIKKITNILDEISTSNNFQFHDFTSVDDISLDIEFIDGYHGSEISFSKILKYLYERQILLQPYINIEYIEKIISNG